MRKSALLLCILFFIVCFATPTAAHSGGTDSKGGHWNRSTGEYHYHHGYGPHDHYDMDGDGNEDCPYEFDMRVAGITNTSDAYDKGYDSGEKAGYSSGFDVGYDRGYDDGKSDAQKDLDLKLQEAEKEGAFDAYLFSAIFGIPAVAGLTSWWLDKGYSRNEQRHRAEVERLKQELNFEKNTNTLRKSNSGLSVPPDLPSDVTLNLACTPIKGSCSPQRPFGDYTVYITPKGKKYHCKYRCCNATNPVHLFKIRNELTACSNCVPAQIRFEQPPSWYSELTNPHKSTEKSPAIVKAESVIEKTFSPLVPTSYESSVFSFIDYQNTVLILKFKSGGEYHYYNVPKYIYDDFLAAPSKGKYYHDRIKNKYPYY